MTKQNFSSHSARIHRSILACSLFGLLFTISQPSPTHAVEPKEYTLSNDMKVILVEDRKSTRLNSSH